MRKLVIVGAGEFAQVAYAYFSVDSDYEVVAFALDRDMLEGPQCCGLPAVAWKDLMARYPPDEHNLFVAIGAVRDNDIRAGKYHAAKAMG